MLNFVFLLSTIALILQCILFPQLTILAYSPFLAFTILRSTFNLTLFLSLIAGVIMDLISNDPMGVHAINYVLTSALLFKIKKHFLFDEPFHISCFTAIISMALTFFGLFWLFLFDRRVPIGGTWIWIDMIGMPIIDGFYAFVWFAAPLTLFSKCKKLWVLFWLNQKRRSRTSH